MEIELKAPLAGDTDVLDVFPTSSAIYPMYILLSLRFKLSVKIPSMMRDTGNTILLYTVPIQ